MHNTDIPSTHSSAVSFAGKKRPLETCVEIALRLCCYFSVFMTIGFVFLLGKDALLFFASDEVSLLEFFTSTTWQPSIGEIGVWPLVTATLMTSFIALVVAVPLSMLVAIYLSEFSSKKVRGILKPVLELLASIPSVVYGFFAVTFLTPLLQSIFGQDTIEIYNNLSAGIVIGILIVPLITSMVEDALHAVPKSLRFAALALGASKVETAMQVVVPASLSGIASAVIVGLSRAIGETMIVALAAGAGPNFTLNPLKAAETITGYMVRISGGDVSYNTIDYNSIFALGFMLLCITLFLNSLSNFIARKFNEVYE